jgi:hypothetical protein
VRLVNAVVEVALDHADAKTLLKTLHVMWPPRPDKPPPPLPLEGQAQGQAQAQGQGHLDLRLHEEDDPQGMMVLDRGALLQVTVELSYTHRDQPVHAARAGRPGGRLQRMMMISLMVARPAQHAIFRRVESSLPPSP